MCSTSFPFIIRRQLRTKMRTTIQWVGWKEFAKWMIFAWSKLSIDLSNSNTSNFDFLSSPLHESHSMRSLGLKINWFSESFTTLLGKVRGIYRSDESGLFLSCILNEVMAFLDSPEFRAGFYFLALAAADFRIWHCQVQLLYFQRQELSETVCTKMPGKALSLKLSWFKLLFKVR